MKKKVTLQFTSVSDLWKFKSHTKCNDYELNIYRRILTTECSEEDITIAIEKYGAAILQSQQQKTE